VFSTIANGLPVYENRGCGNGIPQLTSQVTPLVTALLPPFLRDEINNFVYGGTESVVPAPPCTLQGKFPAVGDTGFPPTQYPQVRANPPTG
jgi:hypothetical protein